MPCFPVSGARISRFVNTMMNFRALASLISWVSGKLAIIQMGVSKMSIGMKYTWFLLLGFIVEFVGDSKFLQLEFTCDFVANLLYQDLLIRPIRKWACN